MRHSDHLTDSRHISPRWWLAIAVSLAMWLVVIIPSGLDIFAVLIFTAPAAALGLFLRWASCLFTPARWNWRVATTAAIAAVMLLPPLLAALITVAGLQRPEDLLPLFVLGAWIALAVGLLAAVFAPPGGVPTRHRRKHRRPPVTRE